MSSHDLTRLQERLRAVEDPVSFLVNLFAHAPVGFAVWAADGHPILTNKAFLDIFGSEPPPEYNVLQDDILRASGLLALFERAFAGETVHVPTFWYDPRELESVDVSEGRRVAVSMTIFPLFKESGEIDVVAATYRDDTALVNANERSVAEGAQLRELLAAAERHMSEREDMEIERARLEAQLRQSQKMQALGTLAGGVAHDFNNLLTVIVGNATLVRDELPDDDDGRRRLLDDIHAAALRATSLVRRILSFARPQEATRRLVDIGPIVSEAVALLRATVPATIAIRVDVPQRGGVPPIFADPVQVHQVVMNLVSNGAHAIGARRGTIAVGVEVVALGEDGATALGVPAGDFVRLSVTDDGTGIDPAILDRIFEPFFSTKAAHEGSGLGLATVHGIVKGHGGALQVKSALGEGTAFHVFFPADGAGAAEQEPVAPEPPPARGELILLVDDEEALTYVTARVLQRKGFQVSAHTDPAKALLEFRARPDAFGAVVTDLSMPGMSGIELAAHLRALRGDVPIILSSGYFRPEDKAAAESAGIDDLIMKPNTVEELTALLHKVLR